MFQKYDIEFLLTLMKKAITVSKSIKSGFINIRSLFSAAF